MKEIVTILKIIIGTFFTISTLILGFLFLYSFSNLGNNEISVFGGIGIITAVLGFLSLVFLTGFIAIIISLHDRMCELVRSIQEMNDLMYTRRTSE